MTSGGNVEFSDEYPVFTDSCDSDEPNCSKNDPRKRAVALSIGSSEDTESEAPLDIGSDTSRSSGSTGNPDSASDSGLDSSSDLSADTEADGSAISEDLCANVIF